MPNHINNFTQPVEAKTFVLQNNRTVEQNLENNAELLMQENLVLKEKIQDLENQILELNQSKNIEPQLNQTAIQEEKISSELQVYENKNLEVYQQETTPLKAKKGIFGTKFVEDKSSKK